MPRETSQIAVPQSLQFAVAVLPQSIPMSLSGSTYTLSQFRDLLFHRGEPCFFAFDLLRRAKQKCPTPLQAAGHDEPEDDLEAFQRVRVTQRLQYFAATLKVTTRWSLAPLGSYGDAIIH